MHVLFLFGFVILAIIVILFLIFKPARKPPVERSVAKEKEEVVTEEVPIIKAAGVRALTSSSQHVGSSVLNDSRETLRGSSTPIARRSIVSFYEKNPTVDVEKFQWRKKLS